MNKAYYKVISHSSGSKNGKVTRIKREIWFEVFIRNHTPPWCEIEPVNGRGSIRVQSKMLKIAL